MTPKQRTRLYDLRELDSIRRRSGWERQELDRLEALAVEDAHAEALASHARRGAK